MNLQIAGKFSFTLLFLVVFITGCQKEKPGKSRMQLITASPWKFSQAGLDLNGDGKIDTTLRPDLLPVCSTDNIFTFKTDSTGILDEAKDLCNPSGPQKSPFTWYFQNNETELFMSAKILPVYDGTSKIVDLTETRFSISRQIGIHGFPAYLTFVIVLVH